MKGDTRSLDYGSNRVFPRFGVSFLGGPNEKDHLGSPCLWKLPNQILDRALSNTSVCWVGFRPSQESPYAGLPLRNVS